MSEPSEISSRMNTGSLLVQSPEITIQIESTPSRAAALVKDEVAPTKAITDNAAQPTPSTSQSEEGLWSTSIHSPLEVIDQDTRYGSVIC